MNIFDLINAEEIATYWLGTASERIPYLGGSLFPSRKQLGLDLSWIKGSRGLPVALTPSEYDTKATLRDRIGVKKIETQMPFFREAMRIGEKDRQELNKAQAASNAELMMPIINKIYDDVGELVSGADVQAERMRMQLLANGKIEVADNRLNYDYDYRFDSDHKATLKNDAKWDALTTSTPVQDIIEWQDTVEEDTGIRPTRAICTRKTWNYLLGNKSIKLDMNPIGGQNVIMTDTMLKQYLLAKVGLTIQVYNKKFSLDGVPTLFYPDDKFTLLPSGNLGNTYFGTTPEESDLMAGNADAKVQIVNTGVAIMTTKEVHPVNVFTVVSAIMLPSFEQIDSVFIATVA